LTTPPFSSPHRCRKSAQTFQIFSGCGPPWRYSSSVRIAPLCRVADLTPFLLLKIFFMRNRSPSPLSIPLYDERVPAETLPGNKISPPDHLHPLPHRVSSFFRTGSFLCTFFALPFPIPEFSSPRVPSALSCVCLFFFPYAHEISFALVRNRTPSHPLFTTQPSSPPPKPSLPPVYPPVRLLSCRLDSSTDFVCRSCPRALVQVATFHSLGRFDISIRLGSFSCFFDDSFPFCPRQTPNKSFWASLPPPFDSGCKGLSCRILFEEQ